MNVLGMRKTIDLEARRAHKDSVQGEAAWEKGLVFGESVRSRVARNEI